MNDYMRKMIQRDGYLEVNTPAIMPRTLWERSGHWAHYQSLMFITESEKRMEIKSASFVTSMAKYVSPNPALPQIAVAGKSNVGKSSLINSLFTVLLILVVQCLFYNSSKRY